jgi:hypothetical protein
MPGPTSSWTEISTYRQCPHRHKLQYTDRWKSPKTALPLELGILWHEIMDLHYSGIKEEGAPRIEAIIDLLNKNGARDPDHKFGPTALWMYDGYREWAKVEDRKWKEIVEVETAFEVPLLDTGILLTGRIDLLVIAWRHLWVVDHKASKTLPNDRELDLDDQTPLYIWAMRQAGYDVRGAILATTRTHQLKRPMDDEERFLRSTVYRADEELEAVVRDAAATITQARRTDVAHERHPDTQTCKWKCPYVEACIGGRRAAHLEDSILKGQGFRQSTGTYEPDRNERRIRVGNPQLRLVTDEGT